MIGIIGAMESEVFGLVQDMEQEHSEVISGITFYIGMLKNSPVVVAQCGVGKVAAAVVAQTMILKYNVQSVINTGVAGALSKDLRICDLVISSETVEHDMDTSPIGDPVGLISGMNIIRMQADPGISEDLTRIAKDQGDHVLHGLVATGDQFIASSAQKEKILGNFPDALCAEMEGSAIAHVCTQNQVPFCILRSISDNADGDADMDFPTFAAKAAEVSIHLLEKYLEEKGSKA